MSEELKRAHAEIDGRLVAQMIIDFHREFRSTYGADVMTSDLCAVGPLQSMIGLAIRNGRLKPAESTGNAGVSAQIRA